MKLGTFVGKEFVEVTTDELDVFNKEVSKLADKYFGAGNYELVTIDNQTTGFVLYSITSKVFDCNGKFALRLKSGHQARMRYMHIMVVKHKGYDESVEGKFYEWDEGYKPEYNITSYSVNVEVTGDWKGYRRKNCEVAVGIIGNNRLWSYDYDTDHNKLFGDATEKVFKDLMWELNNAKPTKNVIGYWR